MFDNKKYASLHKEEQQLLELLSIIYQPVVPTPLAQCANKAGLREPDTTTLLPDTRWDKRSIIPVLQNLEKQGWLVSNNNSYSCAPDLVEDITLQSIKAGRFTHFADTVLELFPKQTSYSGIRTWHSWEAAISDTRIYLYKGDYSNLRTVLPAIYQQFQYTRPDDHYPYLTILGENPRKDLLEVLSDNIFLTHVAIFYQAYNMYQLDDLSSVIEEVKRRFPDLQDDTNSAFANNMLSSFSLVQGRKELFHNTPKNNYFAACWYNHKSCQQLLEGNPQQATETYEKGIGLLRKALRKRGAVHFEDIYEAFYILTLLSTETGEATKKAISYYKALSERLPIYHLLIAYADALTTGDTEELDEEIELLYPEDDAFLLLFSVYIRYWSDSPDNEKWISLCETFYQKADQNGYRWFKAEFAQALAHMLPEHSAEQKEYADIATQTHNETGTKTLFNLVTRQSRWERSLRALGLLAEKGEKSVESASNERLIWLLEEHQSSYSLQPKIQKRTKSGGWTKGRNASLKRLCYEQDKLPFLTPEDLKICNTIREYRSSYYYNATEFDFDMNAAWYALADHPHVYWDQSRNTPIEISQGEIELLVSEEGENIRISLYPEINKHNDESDVVVIKETPTRLRFYKVNDQHYQLVTILGKGLVMPREAEDTLRETLGSLAPMITIQSEISGMDNAESVDPDSRIHIHLLPFGDGLKLSMRVQPFGEGVGPIYPPGHGRANLITEIDDKKIKTRRDLEEETRLADALLHHIPLLGESENIDEEILLEEPQDSLEVLTELHDMGEDVILEWPEGEFMNITASVSSNKMRLNIKQQGEWFDLDGEVVVNEGLVLSLKQLLSMTQANNGRFLRLEEGQYLALTKNLQRKLAAVNAYAEQSKDNIRISGLASIALEDFIDEVGELESDGKWQEHIDRLKEIQTKEHEIPATLQTELRDYQLDGFRWMARLADWGVGACLADDMGLGKTIQSLALILTRASKGPTLVIAPVSVCNNWESEIKRFAPTLNPIFYRGKDRIELLEKLKPFDLLICSYGLLQQDGEALAEISWTTALLDEAQAIKNVGAKRTKAAWNLQADFKVITTGTPIENHLGELWSLFRFLNPGLLGSQDHFTKAYMSPIERYNDRNASYHLKKLIQPFILRRTKTQVLDELPARTEITMEVPLSADERAFYEALRQSAMEKFDKPASDGGVDKNNSMQVLAEITRLRLASCHPRLVMPNSTIPGSKLQAFEELVDELIENKHKALVFSQFVKHLAILREHLDKKGIRYQYLDGSTPQTKRKKSVDAFQNGEGDIFLISLKAGGSGLNLTAADYVIHMDPWWNPAVEDQASDRAHRIGQQRPVTIYRLVAEHTIEEKIVKLHQQKRDLADSLLEGSDISGKMSAEDMLKLIREG
jgi:hypothetical protein